MKTKKTIIILVLIILITSCNTNKLSSEEIKKKILLANSEISSYDVKMNMIMSMNTIVDDRDFKASSNLTYTGSIDKENKQIYLKMTGAIDIAIETELEMDIYYYDDYFYTGTLGFWTKQKGSLDIWDSQDQIKDIIGLLKDGSIKVENEKQKDMNAYKLTITPDESKLVQYALKNQQNDQQNQNTGERIIDYKDMISNKEFTIWVDKDTFIIKKHKIQLELAMNPKNMGTSEDQDSEKHIDLTLSMETKIKNINNIEQIILPDEVSEAIEMEPGSGSLADLSLLTGQAVSQILS